MAHGKRWSEMLEEKLLLFAFCHILLLKEHVRDHVYGEINANESENPATLLSASESCLRLKLTFFPDI